MSKILKDTLDLYEKMANTHSLWYNEKAMPKKGGTLYMDGLTMIKANLDTLTKKIDKMGLNAISSSISSSCEIFHGGHPTIEY